MLKFRANATFVRTPNEVPFLMPTTTDRLPEYVKYGEVFFSIEGKQLKLALYQSTSHEEEEGYEDYLFLPSIKKVVNEHSMSSLVMIEYCGHVVNVEQPTLFNNIVIGYLNNVRR